MVYKDLDQTDKILFLTYIHKTDPHKWDYTGMNTGLRRWYDERKGE